LRVTQSQEENLISYFDEWGSDRIDTPDWQQVKSCLYSEKDFPFTTLSARVIDHMVRTLLPDACVKYGAQSWKTKVLKGDEAGFLDRAETFLRERWSINSPESKGAKILREVCPFSLVQVHLCLNEKLRYQTHTKPVFDRCIVDND
jgi:hypothetical protein